MVPSGDVGIPRDGGRSPEGIEETHPEARTAAGDLYAEHKHKVLIVLQAMDTGGKDGTIKKVFEGVNPQGVRVAHFGAPTL